MWKELDPRFYARGLISGLYFPGFVLFFELWPGEVVWIPPTKWEDGRIIHSEVFGEKVQTLLSEKFEEFVGLYFPTSSKLAIVLTR